ncbi:MAG: hypothetical protein J7M27_10400, partial [Candidatus Latescibacteria bacterium]|nr:hypothetical protein [Candidatus Latescibacterota bacterium]
MAYRSPLSDAASALRSGGRGQPSQHRLNTSMFVDVCDWNGNGKWDLIVTCGWHINYLENVGDNAQPRFRDPVPLSTPDGPIRHISRH